MQNAIVKKLRGVLDGPVDTEPLAVYVLCEARKLLDYEDPTRQPTSLRMFCHWASHVDLAGRGTTEPFVQRVDHVVTNVLSGTTTADTLAAERALVQEFASFDTFRTHLGEFLERHSLPTTLRDRDDAWYAFLEACSQRVLTGFISLSAVALTLTSLGTSVGSVFDDIGQAST